jgi:hypothetical protein
MRAVVFVGWALAGCGGPKVACLDQATAAEAPGCGLESGCCSFDWGQCEDDVDYAVQCDSRSLPTHCDCLEDGVVVGTFEPEGYTCPPNFELPRIETILPLANDACGWNLVP